jgi:hypothetical protein
MRPDRGHRQVALITKEQWVERETVSLPEQFI